jgi:hypothetical protein
VPLTIPNTTVASTSYTDPLTFAGNDVLQDGFFTVANGPVFVQLFEGVRGQAVFQPEVYCPPATYPIKAGQPNRPVAGIRFRAAVSTGTAPQVFGQVFYPNEPGLQAGNPFTSIVSASGALGGALGLYDLVTVPVDVQNSAAELDLYNKTLPAADFTNGRTLLQVIAYGDYLYNRNIADVITLRARLGAAAPGTVIWQPDNLTFGSTINANRGGWGLEFWIVQPGTTANIDIAGNMIVEQSTARNLGTAGGSVFQPTQAAGTSTWVDYIFGNAIAVTLGASDRVFQLTAQWSAASTLNSWRLLGAIVNRLSL